MELNGKTTNGDYVVSGLFKMVDTHGLPLADAVQTVQQRGMGVDWPDFVNDAKRAGWPLRTILARVDEALVDTLGREHADVVVGKIREMEG